MGFNIPQWKFLTKSFKETGLLKYNKKMPKFNSTIEEEGYYGKKMLELGCQQLREVVKNRLQSKTSARSYFKSIGINHISMDIKGCLYSKKIDLREPFPEKYHNKFDILTNSGTTEHIIPLSGQYQAFKNIHVSAKVGCVMIHILPGIGKYYGHCQTYYAYDFFRTLAKLNNYELIFMEDITKRSKFSWIGVCMVKKTDNLFTEDKKSFFKNIQFVSKDKMKRHRKNKKKYMY